MLPGWLLICLQYPLLLRFITAMCWNVPYTAIYRSNHLMEMHLILISFFFFYSKLSKDLRNQATGSFHHRLGLYGGSRDCGKVLELKCFSVTPALCDLAPRQSLRNFSPHWQSSFLFPAFPQTLTICFSVLPPGYISPFIASIFKMTHLWVSSPGLSCNPALNLSFETHNFYLMLNPYVYPQIFYLPSFGLYSLYPLSYFSLFPPSTTFCLSCPDPISFWALYFSRQTPVKQK